MMGTVIGRGISQLRPFPLENSWTRARSHLKPTPQARPTCARDDDAAAAGARSHLGMMFPLTHGMFPLTRGSVVMTTLQRPVHAGLSSLAICSLDQTCGAQPVPAQMWAGKTHPRC